MSIIIRILIGLIGLSFLVFFHETGHFIAARLFGVKVEAFSIGIGPILLHKTINETDYRLSLIPLGGYCAMNGEKEYQEALEKNLKEIKGDKDTLYGIHPFKRLLIAFAGPFFNLLFTFIAMYLIACTGYTYFTRGTKVIMADEIDATINSPAHEAGLQTGDKILRLDNTEIEDWTDLVQYISLRGNEDVLVTVERNNEVLQYTVHCNLNKDTGMGQIGVYSDEKELIQKEYPSHNFFTAFPEAFNQTGEIISVTIKSLGVLFKGVNLTKVVSGPASITSMLGDIAIDGFKDSFRTGFVSVMQMLAFISLSLFFTNLLPVPVLDGGLILFAIIELITRKKMSPKLLRNIQYIGMAFIALLFVLAITGDIQYFINR